MKLRICVSLEIDEALAKKGGILLPFLKPLINGLLLAHLESMDEEQMQELFWLLHNQRARKRHLTVREFFLRKGMQRAREKSQPPRPPDRFKELLDF